MKLPARCLTISVVILVVCYSKGHGKDSREDSELGLEGASKCTSQYNDSGSSRCSKWPNDRMAPCTRKKRLQRKMTKDYYWIDFLDRVERSAAADSRPDARYRSGYRYRYRYRVTYGRRRTIHMGRRRSVYYGRRRRSNSTQIKGTLATVVMSGILLAYRMVL